MTGTPVPPHVRAAGVEANRQKGFERARFIMRLYDRGLSIDEIALNLGVTVPSARSILTRSRRRLGLPTPPRRRVDVPPASL